ncbi:IS110 family transposase [Nocardia vaccinii]|uniref:IS110 family transposase n=1 Tax=Nocardia vaccinii TaxID=1822 RepID=UPI000A02335B
MACPTEQTVFAGVDTHADTHHVAIVNEHGRRLANREFPTTAAGYEAIEQWIKTHGQIARVGIESTGSYGVELARLPIPRGTPPEPAAAPRPEQIRRDRRLRRRAAAARRLGSHRPEELHGRLRKMPRA